MSTPSPAEEALPLSGSESISPEHTEITKPTADAGSPLGTVDQPATVGEPAQPRVADSIRELTNLLPKLVAASIIPMAGPQSKGDGAGAETAAGVHKSYFSRVTLKDESGSEWKKDDWEARKRKGPLPTGLIYDPTPFFAKRPKEMDQLMRDIDAVARVAVGALADKKSAPMRVKIFEHLRLAAESGSQGETANVEVGQLNLRSAKEELEDIGYDIRGRWFWTYTAILVAFLIGCGLPGAWLLLRGLPPAWLTALELTDWTTASQLASTTPYVFPRLVCLTVAVLWIPFGCAAGMWVEYGLRTDSGIKADNLLLLHPGRWKPWQRIVLTTGVSYVFALLLGIGVFQIGVANVLLNDFATTRPLVSFLIGFVTGFGLPYVRDLIYQTKPAQIAREASPSVGKNNT
jgi:hypothetical protein